MQPQRLVALVKWARVVVERVLCKWTRWKSSLRRTRVERTRRSRRRKRKRDSERPQCKGLWLWVRTGFLLLLHRRLQHLRWREIQALDQPKNCSQMHPRPRVCREQPRRARGQLLTVLTKRGQRSKEKRRKRSCVKRKKRLGSGSSGAGSAPPCSRKSARTSKTLPEACMRFMAYKCSCSALPRLHSPSVLQQLQLLPLLPPLLPLPPLAAAMKALRAGLVGVWRVAQ